MLDPALGTAQAAGRGWTRERHRQRSLPAGKTTGVLIQRPPEGATGRGGTFQQLSWGSQVVGGGNCVARWRNPAPGRGVLEG